MFPGIPVVAYVNTNADTKSEVDVCCASGNAAKVVKWAMKQWKTNKVIFLPDKFLAQNVARDKGANIFFPNMDASPSHSRHACPDCNVGNPESIQINLPNDGITLIGWEGKCEVHEKFTPQDVVELRKDFPGIYLMAHPECPPSVVEKVDFAGSTGAMIKKISNPDIQDRPVAFFTECAMVEMLAAQHKNVVQACSIQKRCPHMAQNNLETVIAALENMQYEITVPEDIRQKAELPIRRMIAI